MDGENSKETSLQIDMLKEGSELRLTLEIEALFGMHARYEFNLKQVEIQRIDILEAKLRDLTEQIEGLTKKQPRNKTKLRAWLQTRQGWMNSVNKSSTWLPTSQSSRI